MNAVIYIRRSKESNERTVSLREQEAKCRAYAAMMNFTVQEVVEDDGVSGGDRDRFAGIELSLFRHNAKALVVYHMDRLARDVAATLDHMAKWAKQNVRIFAVNRGEVECKTSGGHLMTGVEQLFAENYRKQCSEKTKAGLARLKTEGRRHCLNAPVGYRWENGMMVEDVAEQRAMAEAKGLLDQGFSLREVCRRLSIMGYFTRKGGTFAVSTLHNALHREVDA